MDIGVPKEVKDREFRVGLSPASVKELCDRGHSVVVETQAGVGAGFSDEDYVEAGGAIAPDATGPWQQEMVVKVKEPLPVEYELIQNGQLLFTYLHLAAGRQLTERLVESGVSAIAYESVEKDGTLPLLMPMSVIAGRLSVQFGARFLEKQQGGRGVLLGGIPGVSAGKVAILGGGVVGTEAAKMAVGLGAQVTVIDISVERLSYLETLFGSRVNLLYSNAPNIAAAVTDADLVVGSVLVPNRKAPTLVTKEMVSDMRTGSVIVDVAVDQGGCIETLRVTSHSEPVYTECGVVHYGVPNMPGAVPWTATQALNNSTLPYVLQLAASGMKALDQPSIVGKGLKTALNVQSHRLVHPAVQKVFPDLVA
ncbi:alanine dehydrogenase [cf. Phormidesmis sp. LEGE 11477]|uniref:alanine dehydrogenase n=1 Tax=cf. Phormidesmis sp. LEGE 11477 TaxID=1828680 RepID=UPI001882F7B3|nr:alanine dehydrogenase [cf. Phormidesmis sp. LEGE 11477]MBE9059982.1 alanine dehydrogenase [cf. Phormidesmis sp. LEGE 11477]